MTNPKQPDNDKAEQSPESVDPTIPVAVEEPYEAGDPDAQPR